MNENIHILNPLEAWNASRHIASQVDSAIDSAEDEAPEDLPYDPHLLEEELKSAEPPVGNLWPQTPREVLYHKHRSIKQDQDGEYMNKFSKEVMKILKEEGMLMTVSEKKKDNLTADDYDPKQLSKLTIASSDEVAIAIDLVHLYNDSDSSYREVVTSEPVLENIRTSSVRVELVNSSTKKTVNQILHMSDWIASTSAESGSNGDTGVSQSAPMGYKSSTG